MSHLYHLSIALILPFFLSAQPYTLQPLPYDFIFPLDISHTQDGRLYVVEQRGQVKVIESDGTLNDIIYLNLWNKISFGGERGLLGLAFHPNFQENGLLYVNYTNRSGTTHISSFSFQQGDLRVNSDTENILLDISQPYGNHNGGCLKFGPDGHLYIAMGDGGWWKDPHNNAQNDQSLLGKMLRIGVEEEGGYFIPEDNPFVQAPFTSDEIWASGLRNPWRFSFDRATGDLWIGDVGQDDYEEINRVKVGEPAGLNFGWRCREGHEVLDPRDCLGTGAFTFPLYVYPTTRNIGESITGGYVYRGTAFPELQGKYIYGDYASGKIWALQELPTGEILNELIAQHQRNDISSFGEDADGELYITGYHTGKVYRLVKEFVSTSSPFINHSALSITPNPFDNFLTIQLETTQTQVLTIQLINFMGQVLRQQTTSRTIGKHIVQLDTSDLPIGAYMLSITDGRDVISKKLIK